MTTLLIFTAPLLLLIMIALLIRARGNLENAGRHYFLFLLWITIGSLTFILLSWLVPLAWLDFALVLFPTLPGLIVLTFLHWREWESLDRLTKIPVLTVFGILLAATIVQLVLVSLQNETPSPESIFFGLSLISVSAFMFIAWKWGNRFPLLMFVIAFLYLVFFLTFDLGGTTLLSESMSVWKNVLSALAYLAIPGMVIPVMAKLAAETLQVSPTAQATKPMTWIPILGRLLLVFILFGTLLYTYRWLWLWDGIDDGIRGLFMILVAAVTATSTGILIVLTNSGWRRWMGLGFALTITIPLYFAASTGFGSSDSNYTITEQRATRIQEAIEGYRGQTGSYPLSLAELIPGHIWRIPLPMIIPEQSWCYQGGTNYYRLGAVYREHWSSPYFSVRVYASAGNALDEAWECDRKLADAISQSPYFDSPPTPMPLAMAVASVQKVIVEPVAQAESFALGGWSPDGAYLAFTLNEVSMTNMEQMTIDLRFLDAKTRALCQPDESKQSVANSYSLSEHSAWLLDGRFLFLSDDGQLLAFTPCTASADGLVDQIPVKFTYLMSVDQQSGHILARDEVAYWLLDANTLDIRKVEGASVEAYRPLYAWSPDGERLAMSLMSGPDIENDAFLYIVDWTSGQVKNIIPLADVSDQHLPLVQWLTDDELLVHGKTLTVMDFRSEPSVTTDVLKDIFLLDIEYPNDVWGTDVVSTKGDEGYFIGVQVNHPRNKEAYVYSSKTGQVEVFHHDVSTLIFLPDGQWMRLLKWEDPPTPRDEYELVWLDGSHEKTRIRVEGHRPRAHFQMLPGYLPRSSQLFFSSSQGISLVSIPDGKTIVFWDLSSDVDYFSVTASPNGEALIAQSDGDGLYYIPLLPH